MAETLPSADPVDKTCRGSRFCSFSGPFHSEHLLVLGVRSQPTVVGRCYSPGCGAYVCSRCAHRRAPDQEIPGFPAEAAVLCCPFDGEPLGDGDDWLVLGAGGAILDRSAGFPRSVEPFRQKLVEQEMEELLVRLSVGLGLRSLAETPALQETAIPKEAAEAIGALFDSRNGRILAASWPRDARRTLLLLAHERVVPEQQMSLYRLLEDLLERSPRTSVLLEGLYGPRPRRIKEAVGDRHRRETLARERITAGGTAAEALFRLHPAPAKISGADDPELLAGQEKQLQALETALRAAVPPQAAQALTWKSFTDALASACFALLRDLEEQGLGEKLRGALAAREGLRRQGALLGSAQALAAQAAALGISLDGAPAVRQLLAAVEAERGLDFTAVERERGQLLADLAARAGEPLDEERKKAIAVWQAGIRPDEAALVALAREASGQAPRPAAGWRRWFGGRRTETAPAGPPSWFDVLAALSVGVRTGAVAQARYYERLSGLQQALGVQFGDHFRRYVDYVLQSDRVDRHRLTQEMPALADEIVIAAVSSAVEAGVVELRFRLEELIQLLRLQAPAARVEPLLERGTGAIRWLLDVARLASHAAAIDWTQAPPLADAWKLATILAPLADDLLPQVRDFYASVSRRSERLIATALPPAGGAPFQSVLVCARFHLHEILRLLGSESDVAWALVVPSPEAEPSRASGWGWVLPGEEHASLRPL